MLAPGYYGSETHEESTSADSTEGLRRINISILMPIQPWILPHNQQNKQFNAFQWLLWAKVGYTT